MSVRGAIRNTLVGLSLIITACATGTREADTITKEEAQLLGGSADGIDTCAENDWYGDNECDTFCATPDPDCLPDCNGLEDDLGLCPDSEDLGGCLESADVSTLLAMSECCEVDDDYSYCEVLNP